VSKTPARSAVEFVRKERVDKGSEFLSLKLRRDTIILILPEVQVKHMSRARCAQAE
jgi:hypothetical protein